MSCGHVIQIVLLCYFTHNVRYGTFYLIHFCPIYIPDRLVKPSNRIPYPKLVITHPS